MGILALRGRKMTKPCNFLGEKVNIIKLATGQVKEIQELAKQLEADEAEQEEGGLKLLTTVIKMGVEEGEQLEESDFTAWPIDELRKLSEEIMKFSGLRQEDEEGK